MKIKKVIIQAFRAYNKAEDCTFDFQMKDGSCADFVSIYAPNGFGKTSFYDAVEWGITNNIYRFIKHYTVNRLYAQNEKHLKYEIENEKSPQYILRHKYSSVDLPSYVKLFLANPDEERCREIVKAARVDSSDYSFDDGNSEHLYFRKVILSQDSIDSFLKEDNSEARYIKFIDFFGDRNLDACYFNLLNLIKANDGKIQFYQKQISSYKNQNLLEFDLELLSKINFVIKKLIEKGERIFEVSPSFEEADFVNFSNIVSSNRITVHSIVEKNRNKINTIKLKELQIEEYSESKIAINGHLGNLDNMYKIKDIFKLIQELNNKVLSNNKDLNVKVNEVMYLEEILSLVPSYEIIHENIEIKKQIYKHDTDILNEKMELLRNVRNSIAELEIIDDNILNEIAELESKLKSISELNDIINNSKDEKKELSDYYSDQRISLNNINSFMASCNLKQKSIEFEINQFKIKEVPNSVKSDLNFAITSKRIEEASTTLKSINRDLSNIDKDINKFLDLSSELSKLSLLALSIISRDESSSCPACGYDFISFEKLVNSVKNNSILDDRVKVLVLEKENLHSRRTAIDSEIDLYFSQLYVKKSEELAQLKSDLSSSVIEKQELESNIKSIELRVSYYNELEKELLQILLGLSIEEYISDSSKKLIICKDNYAKNSFQLNTEVEKETQLVAEIDIARKKLSFLDYEIKSLENSVDFIKVGKFSLRFDLSKMNVKNSVSEMILKNKSHIDSINLDIVKITNSLSDLKKQVSSYNESSLDSDIHITLEVVDKLKIFVSTFDSTLRNVFDQDISNYTREDLELLFKEIHNLLFLVDKNYNDILVEYQKIDEYKNNIIPFLKFKKNQSEIQLLEEKIQFQRNVVGAELIKEKEKIASFINKQIESFFYEDLINKIYRKIDPHPQYKKIAFKCDFSGESPKLNVYVNDNNRQYLIPNLYFSTAQMNILSLSIFLAKAINATNDSGEAIDCIFIDDPIQSMDSINILSTIDLLRSISVNLRKQIILSTHDEHFHNLLKTKMPSNIFKSKFIELETFGKVKQ